jgi:hypothetical protein
MSGEVGRDKTIEARRISKSRGQRRPTKPVKASRLLEPSPCLRRRLSRSGLLLALAVLGLWLWATSLVPALGTDALIYHLTIPATWLQRGFLSQVDLPFHDSAAEHSPMLTQSISYCLMRLTGDDGLTWLIQPVFFLLALRLFFVSCRLLGLRRDAALSATALLMVFRPFLRSAQTVNNELVLTCGCALLLCGLLRTRLRGGWPLAWAAGGVALMLVTKVIGIVYATAGVLLLIPAVWLRFRRSGPAGRGRTALETVAAAGIVVAGTGLYLRNWALHGNPLYPAEVRIAGATVFAGLYDASVLVDHGWSLSAFSKMLFQDDSVFALKWAFSIPLWLGFAVSLALLLRRRRRLSWAVLAATAIFPLLSVALYFAVTPFWGEHRLLFPVYYALWLAAASGVALAGRLNGRIVPRVLTCLLLGALLVRLSGLEAWGQLQAWLVAGIVVLIGLLRWPRLIRRPVLIVPMLLAAIASGPWWYPHYRAARLSYRAGTYSYRYGTQGRVWNLLDRLSSGRAVVFPLFGSRLSNRVGYVPISADDRPRPIVLQRGDSLYLRLSGARRGRMDEQFWLAGLRRRGVDLLYLVADPKVGDPGPELGVVRRHPEIFRRMVRAEGVYLFRLRR